MPVIGARGWCTITEHLFCAKYVGRIFSALVTERRSMRPERREALQEALATQISEAVRRKCCTRRPSWIRTRVVSSAPATLLRLVLICTVSPERDMRHARPIRRGPFAFITKGYGSYAYIR